MRVEAWRNGVEHDGVSFNPRLDGDVLRHGPSLMLLMLWSLTDQVFCFTSCQAIGMLLIGIETSKP